MDLSWSDFSKEFNLVNHQQRPHQLQLFGNKGYMPNCLCFPDEHNFALRKSKNVRMSSTAVHYYSPLHMKPNGRAGATIFHFCGRLAVWEQAFNRCSAGNREKTGERHAAWDIHARGLRASHVIQSYASHAGQYRQALCKGSSKVGAGTVLEREVQSLGSPVNATPQNDDKPGHRKALCFYPLRLAFPQLSIWPNVCG